MQLNALLPLLQHQIHLQQQQSLFPSISTTQSNSTIEALNLQLLQNQMISVLRQLCDDDDGELLKNAKAQSEEAINRSRITDSINLTQIHQHPSRLGIKEEPVLFNEERKPLRKIIKEEDLPETVGPDSPLRHHPKYFNQNRLKCPEEELLRGFETITTLFMMNGYLPDEMREQFNQRKIKALSAPASPTPISTNRTVKPEPECPIEDFMEQVISRELVTCE
ncbi:unnamed protein product, partial [Mesorhabditis belari]|uniref:Uncharacterized protein n=1 Tax=Mesorhabditis belari TaxID=2138241 RepID=A0AAF3F0M1_9BILA